MEEGDLVGVEGLSGEVEVGGWGEVEFGAAVEGVADHGVAEVGHVDAELVGSAGFWGEFDEGAGGGLG